MCGIVGIVGRPPEDVRVIERMTDRLRHRGPDDRGTWRSPEAHLGHTRLAILDLSPAGHQPMQLGELVLTYNGEIYNFRELRRELAGPFVSEGDTEVLLHLYARDGAACLPKLNGMFAFAVWDQRHRLLFAARDRFGIKPLYYRPLPGGLAFASEIKALLELGQPATDPSAIRDVLTYGWVPTPKTAFSGIFKLPPGHALTWRDGRITVERYWQPEPRAEITDMAEACERLDALLGDVIPEHTLADVPVGLFLSGGIDSTTVTAYLDRPMTFTLSQDVSHRSEAPAARIVAEHFGTDHHEGTAGAIDLERALATMPNLYDEPFGDSAAWSVWLISRLARQHVTVALSGEGGDGLFCGYQWYSRWFTTPSSPVHAALARIVPPVTNFGRSLHRNATGGLERYATFLGVFTPQQKRTLLGPRLVDAHDDDLWFYREHWREDLQPLQRIQWADFHTYLPDGMLTKVDRASMAHSLEVRPPLLDHRLVEFAFSLDPTLQRDIQGDRGKLLVRRLMADRIPPGHFDRPKRGFNLPIRRWVRRHQGMIDAALDRLSDAGVIRRPRIAVFKNEQTWALLVLDRWLERFGGL
jgi:asparagine synthase (glutamine-hydrolysing)